jgi:hypothetical protein
MTKVLSQEKEEKDGMIVINRVVLDEVFGRIKQRLVITRNEVVYRSWFDRHYSEISLRRMKTRDGRDAVDVVWGHEGEGRSDWYWTIIIADQIDQLFDIIRDYDTFKDVISRLYDGCLAKNVNKRVECNISALIKGG